MAPSVHPTLCVGVWQEKDKARVVNEYEQYKLRSQAAFKKSKETERELQQQRAQTQELQQQLQHLQNQVGITGTGDQLNSSADADAAVGLPDNHGYISALGCKACVLMLLLDFSRPVSAFMARPLLSVLSILYSRVSLTFLSSCLVLSLEHSTVAVQGSPCTGTD